MADRSPEEGNREQHAVQSGGEENMNKVTRGQLRTLVLAAMQGGCAALSALATAQTALSSIIRTSSFEYDAAGLLIREVIEPESPQECLQTVHGYTAQGNPSSKSSSACAAASGHTLTSAGSARGTANEYLSQTVVIEEVSYSTPAGVFATRTTNALNHSESYEYDPRHGQVTKLTGPNGGVTTWAYDSFGHKTRESRADGNPDAGGTLARCSKRFGKLGKICHPEVSGLESHS